jgi:hypothetical protein
MITVASPKSPVAGSPVQLEATATTRPGLRDSASARIHGGIRVEAFDRLAGGHAIVGGHEGQGDVVSDIHRSHSLPSRRAS